MQKILISNTVINKGEAVFFMLSYSKFSIYIFK